MKPETEMSQKNPLELMADDRTLPVSDKAIVDTEMALPPVAPPLWRALFPTRAILLIMAIGFTDLISTAVLHQKGLIVELNPLMKPLIEQSEWLFAFVKGMTLVVAWLVMLRHAETHLPFIRKACIYGSAAYLAVFCVWFTIGSL